jgi:acylphosphatase
MPIARRALVSGRVQGVFFRASTREKAESLGLGGYARNLPDGRVEVLAVGELKSVEVLLEWLWRGPPAAHVANVEVQHVDPATLGEVPKAFTTGRD